MPAIITATDFSDLANHAVDYACRLAADMGAELIVTHTFVVPIAFSDTPMPVMPVDESMQIAEERMAKEIARLQAIHSGIGITGKVMYGDLVDALQEYTEDVQPAFVVIGNSTGEDNNLWLGSNAISALRHLPYTVVAVPHEAPYKPVKNICFACDYKHISNKLPAAQLMTAVQDVNAQLHVLNVGHSSQTGMEKPEGAALLEGMLAAVSPQYHFVENEDIEAGIQNFIAANNMDWLVVLPHSHGFLEGLFHKSHTKAIAQGTHIPVVALHERKEHE